MVCGLVAEIFLYIEVSKKDHNYDAYVKNYKSRGPFGTHYLVPPLKKIAVKTYKVKKCLNDLICFLRKNRGCFEP